MDRDKIFKKIEERERIYLSLSLEEAGAYRDPSLLKEEFFREEGGDYSLSSLSIDGVYAVYGGALYQGSDSFVALLIFPPSHERKEGRYEIWRGSWSARSPSSLEGEHEG